MSLRASVTSEIVLDAVRLPAEAAFPDVRGLRGPLSCLNEARYGIVWGAMGAARSCLNASLAYANHRVQVRRAYLGIPTDPTEAGRDVRGIRQGRAPGTHLGRRKDAGTLLVEQVSLGKLNNVRAAIDIGRTARTILGANGITLDYPVIRHMNNLESVLTYEGTEEMHTLVVGQALTGRSAFR